MVIEPVKGQITLKGLGKFRNVEAIALSSGTEPLDSAVQVDVTATEARIPVGRPATVWYLIRIHR